MGIESVREEILNLAEKEAAEKIAQAQNKAKAIENEAVSEIEAQNRKTDAEIEALMSSIAHMMEASVKFELKKIELSGKKEMLDKVFENAVKKIETLDDKTQNALTNILLKDAMSQIDVAHVICNEKTKKWLPKSFDIKTQDMLGGVIAETRDTKLRVDNRYETILEEIRREALKKIAHKIF